jgi:hypothetical protein
MSFSNLSATDVSGFMGSVGLIGSSLDGGKTVLGSSDETVDFNSFGDVVLIAVLGLGLLSMAGCLGVSAGFTSAYSVCDSAFSRADRRSPAEKPTSKHNTEAIPTARTIPHQTSGESRSSHSPSSSNGGSGNGSPTLLDDLMGRGADGFAASFEGLGVGFAEGVPPRAGPAGLRGRSGGGMSFLLAPEAMTFQNNSATGWAPFVTFGIGRPLLISQSRV